MSSFAAYLQRFHSAAEVDPSLHKGVREIITASIRAGDDFPAYRAKCEEFLAKKADASRGEKQMSPSDAVALLPSLKKARNP